jgi:hypothetical protein
MNWGGNPVPRRFYWRVESTVSAGIKYFVDFSFPWLLHLKECKQEDEDECNTIVRHSWDLESSTPNLF